MAEQWLPILLAAGFTASFVLLLRAAWVFGLRAAATYQQKVLNSTSSSLSEIFIFMDPRALMRWSIVSTIITPVLLLLISDNAALAVLGAALSLFGPRMARQRLEAQRRKKVVHQLPDTLDALVGALRSGLSLQQSLGLLSEQLPVPSNQEFLLVVRKLRIGVTVDDALGQLEQRVGSVEYTLFITAMCIARELGGNLTESLERLADTMRKKMAMEGKIDALTAQGKLQGLIVGCLPLFLMMVLNEMEHEAMQPLFHTPIGYGALLVIALLELVGFVLIRKIVRIDV